MSLDYFYDAQEIMRKGDHPFIIICAPIGTKNAHIAISDEVMLEPPTANKIMQSMDMVYDDIYAHFDIIEEEIDDEEN